MIDIGFKRKGVCGTDIFEFDAVIVQSDERGSGAFVHFPYDVRSAFGMKGRVKVACEFDGVPYRGSIVDMGCGPVIGVLKSIREQIRKQAGDAVHVRLWKDDAPREVTVPDALAKAFAARPEAAAVFERLSYSHRREYASWVGEAKKEETRAARAGKAVEMLLGGKRSPG